MQEFLMLREHFLVEGKKTMCCIAWELPRIEILEECT